MKEKQIKLKYMDQKQQRKCYGFYVFKGNIDNFNNFRNRFSNCFFDIATGQKSIIENNKGDRIMRMKKKSLLKDLLKDYARNHRYFTTIDVDNWKRSIQGTFGNIPGIMCASRYIRKMADKRESDWYCLHRLTNEEKKQHGFNTKFGAYKYIK